MDIYLPIAEVSVNLFLLLGMGGGVGFLSGIFGVGGGFPDDAAPHLHRHSAGGRGRLRGEPDPGLVELGRDGAHAAQQCRCQDGDGAGDRRRHRLGVRRLAVQGVERARSDRSGDLALLPHFPGRGRLPDVRRIRPRLVPGPAQRRPSRQAAPASLAARASLQDALSAIAPLYQRADAAGPGRAGRHSRGDHGCRRRLLDGAGDDLRDRHADPGGGRHLALSNRLRDRRHHLPALGQQSDRRHLPGVVP